MSVNRSANFFSPIESKTNQNQNKKYLHQIAHLIENNITNPVDILHWLLKFAENSSLGSEQRNFFKGQKKSANQSVKSILSICNRIDLLSAFISYFPNYIHDIPAQLREQLTISTGKTVIRDAIDSKVINRLVSAGQAKSLQTIISDQADGGQALIENLCAEIKKQDNYSPLIAPLGELSSVIEKLPLTIGQQVVDILCEKIENDKDNYPNNLSAKALGSLSHVINKLPDKGLKVLSVMHQKLYLKLPDNLTTAFGHLINSLEIELPIQEQFLYQLSKKLRSSDQWVRSDAINALQYVEKAILQQPDKGEELINSLCAFLDSKTESEYTKTNIAKVMGKLSNVLINLPDQGKKALTHLQNNLINIRCLHCSCCNKGENAKDIDLLINVLKHQPDQGREFIGALFSNLLKNKYMNVEIQLELIEKWSDHILQLPDKGGIFVQQCISYIQQETDESWKLFFKNVIPGLAKIISHLPDKELAVIETLNNLLSLPRAWIPEHAARGLGALNESVARMEDKGQSIIHSLLSFDYTQELNIIDAAIQALGCMANVLTKLPDECEKVINKLSQASGKLEWSAAIALYQLRELAPLLADKGEFYFGLLQKKIHQIPTDLKPKQMEISGKIVCLLDNKFNKSELVNSVLVKTENPEYALAEISDFMALDHKKQLSWICILTNSLQRFETDPKSDFYLTLVNLLGEIYSNMVKEEMVYSHIPVGDVLTIVKEYSMTP